MTESRNNLNVRTIIRRYFGGSLQVSDDPFAHLTRPSDRLKRYSFDWTNECIDGRSLSCIEADIRQYRQSGFWRGLFFSFKYYWKHGKSIKRHHESLVLFRLIRALVTTPDCEEPYLSSPSELKNRLMVQTSQLFGRFSKMRKCIGELSDEISVKWLANLLEIRTEPFVSAAQSTQALVGTGQPVTDHLPTSPQQLDISSINEECRSLTLLLGSKENEVLAPENQRLQEQIKQLEQLHKKIAEYNKEIAEYKEKSAELDKKIKEFAERNKELAERNKELAERSKKIAKLDQEITELDQEIERFRESPAARAGLFNGQTGRREKNEQPGASQQARAACVIS